MDMPQFKPEKYVKYPVLIPRFKARVKRLRDLTRIIKLISLSGLALIISSSLIIGLYHDPISYYIILLSLTFTIPLPIRILRKVFYNANWIRLRIESETPYFLSSLKFLVDSGRKLTESLKIIVSERIFKYISDSLYGVEDATSDMEIIDIASRSGSPFLARAVRTLYTDIRKIDSFIDESLKRLSHYGVDYRVNLNSAFKSIFYTIVLSSLIPITVMLYHSFTYQTLEENYVIEWTWISVYYLASLTSGLALILISVILAYKPSLYPVLSIRRYFERRDLMIISLTAFLISIPAALYPPYIIIAFSILIYMIYRKYTTIGSLRQLSDIVYTASHLFKELDNEYVMQSLLAKNYDKYISERISMGLKSLKESGVIEFDDENLKPFFKTISYSGENRNAVDEYALNVNALFNIPKYVDDEIKFKGLKPYSDYTMLYLAFIPLMLASGYIMGVISIPIAILFKFLRGFNISNLYNMSNINMSNWNSIWNIPSPDTLLPIPSLSLNVFNIFTSLIVAVIFTLGVLIVYSRHDYNPIELVKYSAMIVGVSILITLLAMLIPV